jgi:hypothetical protein
MVSILIGVWFYFNKIKTISNITLLKQTLKEMMFHLGRLALSDLSFKNSIAEVTHKSSHSSLPARQLQSKCWWNKRASGALNVLETADYFSRGCWCAAPVLYFRVAFFIILIYKNRSCSPLILFIIFYIFCHNTKYWTQLDWKIPLSLTVILIAIDWWTQSKYF